MRGLLHRHRGQPRQDRFSLVYDEQCETLLVSVCDGVGSLALSHEAASLVAGAMPHAYLAHGDWPSAIAEANQELTTYAAGVAESAPPDSDPHQFAMATTYVGGAIGLTGNRRQVSVVWTDDSAVWLLTGGQWTKVTAEPQPSDDAVYSTSVRALPHAQPRFRISDLPVPEGAIFFMSDGVGAPLEQAREVRDTLARWWASPPDAFTFAAQVGFSRKTHIDDRTVVGVWFGPESATVQE